MERVIRLGFPSRSLLKFWKGKIIDGDPSFNDQTELTSEIIRIAKDDAFPMINERDAVARSKREVRRKRDCDLSAKHCEFLLQTVQNYLVALSNKLPVTGGGTSVSADILKCLECKKLMNSLDENDKDHTPQSKDQYFPHDYAEQNRSSDFGPAVIKLLDETENGSKAEIKQTEAAQIQPVETSSIMNLSQDVTNQSSNGASTSETTTINIPISINHTDSNGSQRIYVNDTDINNSTINDKLPDSTPAANHSHVTKIQSDESVPTMPSIDQQHRVTSKTVTSVKPWFTTESSSMRTQYSTITGDEQSKKTTIAADSTRTTEMGIRTIIDLTKQITENVMSVPANDVTGIDGGTVRPSFEGHPENRSAAATNGAFQEEYEKEVVK